MRILQDRRRDRPLDRFFVGHDVSEAATQVREGDLGGPSGHTSIHSPSRVV